MSLLVAFNPLWEPKWEPTRDYQTVSLGTSVGSVGYVGMALIKRLRGVPTRYGGEEHSGWVPANAATPLPTPLEEALLDLEISEVRGGYIL
jgi:hypothetical protein